MIKSDWSFDLMLWSSQYRWRLVSVSWVHLLMPIWFQIWDFICLWHRSNSIPSSHSFCWKVSLVFRRLQRFLLSTCPSYFIQSWSYSWRTVAFLVHASCSWILTTSSLASSLRVLVDLSKRCFCFHFMFPILFCISVICLTSLLQGTAVRNLWFINSFAGANPHWNGAVL